MSDTFRPRSNLIWAGTSFTLILLFAANSYLTSASSMQFFWELFLCVILTAITYLIWIRPKLVLQETEIKVVNPIRTELIAYHDVLDFETKWALKIIHNQGHTVVWVAPASGKRRWIADTTYGWYGRNIPLSDSNHTDSVSMSESLDSLSGQAAYLIRERIKRLH